MLCSGSPRPSVTILMLLSDGSLTSLWSPAAEWYYQHNLQPLSFRKKEENAAAEPVVYTPLHGVGLSWVQQVSYNKMIAPHEKTVDESSSMHNRLHS